jgi:hypothetical protein
LIMTGSTPDLNVIAKQAETYSMIPLNGKKPFESQWTDYCVKKRVYNEEDFKGRNAGICCGPASGVLVLDIDDPDMFAALKDAGKITVPETYTVMTGSGKPHYYFKYPNDGGEYGNKSLKHPVYNKHTVFDIRGNGGQVVAAGSCR